MKKYLISVFFHLVILLNFNQIKANSNSTLPLFIQDSLQSQSVVYVNLPECNKYQTLDIHNWNHSSIVRYANDKRNLILNYFYSNKYKKGVNPYSNNIYWPAPYKTMIHAFSLKYKIPYYQTIKYYPSFIKETFLPDLSKGLGRWSSQQSQFASLNSQSSLLDTFRDLLIIYQPKLVKFQWNEIPSPHRFILDGILLDKKAAQEAFVLTNFEIKKLEKPKVITKEWTYTGVEALQFSQSYFSNWVKGGQNTFALLSDLRTTANYKHKRFEWDNKGVHKLGIISAQGESSRINDDLIQLTSKGGVNASKNWYYSTLFDFKSQFFYGRDKNDRSKILSGFMSPAYLTFAIGMDYKRKDFTILLSPYTSKVTLVLDTMHVDASRYDIPVGRKSSSKSGASIYNSFKWKINTEFILTSNFDCFYGYMDKTPETQLDWELIFDMRINKYLSTRINTTFRYYESESKSLQLKENFSVVFSYKF